MKFETLIALVGDLEWFDLATVVQLGGERRATTTNQLYRLAKLGKLTPLRRGMYALAPPYRKTRLQPAALANALLRPSYLSGLWALSYYGLIPESVTIYTSVTTRSPALFANAVGEFAYRSIKREAFFGYTPIKISGRNVLLASPEKALLDHFYLSTGEWTAPRMHEMRFAHNALIDADRLKAFARRIGKPRLLRAVNLWSEHAQQEAAAEVQL